MKLNISVVDGGQRARAAPPPKKKSVKYFSGNYYVKFGRFLGKNHAKSSQVM